MFRFALGIRPISFFIVAETNHIPPPRNQTNF